MLPITNISITKSAEVTLRQQQARTRLRAGEVFGMWYIEFFKEADGSAVKGFVPGYQASSWSVQYITADWLCARLPNGMQFYFLPEFRWSPREHYRVDNAGGSYALFSINHVT